jgi:hypothetical protein
MSEIPQNIRRFLESKGKRVGTALLWSSMPLILVPLYLGVNNISVINFEQFTLLIGLGTVFLYAGFILMILADAFKFVRKMRTYLGASRNRITLVKSKGLWLGVGLIAPTTIGIYQNNQYLMIPFTIFMVLMWPAASGAFSLYVAKIFDRLHRLIHRKQREDYKFSLEDVVELPRTWRMAVWTTFSTIGIMYAILTGAGYLPESIVDLTSNIGMLVPIYMVSVTIASALNVTIWLLRANGYICMGSRAPINMGDSLGNSVSYVIAPSTVISVAVFINSYGAAAGGILTMFVFLSGVAFVSTLVSYKVARKTLFTRLSRDLKTKLGTAAA